MLFSLLILVALVAFWAGLNSLTKYLDSRTRKFAFAGAILVFFFIMLFHRRGEVEAAAETHDLQETNIGNVDLGGSTARFVLTSFRGPLVCIMWWDSEESKEHHEYHKLEQRYRQLTKLQPHFRSAWIYQGWNMAYNISVEFDRVEDKYFYIAEGTSWIAEGERINRARIYDPRPGAPNKRRELGDPDLRWHIGFMIQDKLSVSDEASTHKCFFHLSCIPPSVWDPSKLRREPEALERFKREYPQLTRQIRLLRNIPEGADKQLNTEMLAFFTAHQRLPSLFAAEASAEGGPQAKLPREFPLWPDGMRPANPEREDSHDPYDVAKCWYQFALEPLPPPDYMDKMDPSELHYYRLPKNMVSIIFRKQPAQAKSLQALALDKDGWFDQSQKAWNEAVDMWRDFGVQFELDLPKAVREVKEKKAKWYYENFAEEARAGIPPPRIRQNEENMAAFEAFFEMRDLEARRRTANYFHWRTAAETNAKNEARLARSHLYQGHNHRTDVEVSRAEYEKGFVAWKPLLVVPRKFKTDSLDFIFLLGNTLGALPGGNLLQPEELFERTDFGKDAQAQHDLGQYHDFYLIIRTQQRATNVMHAAVAAWELAQLAAQHFAAPLGGGPGAILPGSPKPFRLNELESAMLARAIGPLDLYLHEEVLGQSVRRQQHQAAPDPSRDLPRPPGQPFQPTGATTK